MSNDDNLQITNTVFPPPPAYYKAYTNANLTKYALAESSGTSKQKGLSPVDVSPEGPEDVEDGEVGGMDELRKMLEKPNVEWVKEEGKWMCFGKEYRIDPQIPTPSEIGLPPFTDPSEPPSQSLPPLLHSFLHTLLLLVERLTETARNPGELEEKGWAHEGDQYIQHMSNLAATMMVSANQLRGVQAEATLVLLMEKQLATRREQTTDLRAKCRNIASSIKELKTAAAEMDVGPKSTMKEVVEVD